jgi:hypothetical protein
LAQHCLATLMLKELHPALPRLKLQPGMCRTQRVMVPQIPGDGWMKMSNRWLKWMNGLHQLLTPSQMRWTMDLFDLTRPFDAVPRGDYEAAGAYVDRSAYFNETWVRKIHHRLTTLFLALEAIQARWARANLTRARSMTLSSTT